MVEEIRGLRAKVKWEMSDMSNRSIKSIGIGTIVTFICIAVIPACVTVPAAEPTSGQQQKSDLARLTTMTPNQSGLKEGFYWLTYTRGDIAYSYVVYVKFRKTHSRLGEHPHHTFRVYELGLTEDPSDLDELVKGFRFEDSVVGLGNVQRDKFSFFLPAYSTSVRVFQGKILGDEGRAINGHGHETRKSIERTFHFDFSMEHLRPKG